MSQFWIPIFFHYIAALDTVNHAPILKTFYSLGFCNTSTWFFTYYLIDFFSVTLAGLSSSSQPEIRFLSLLFSMIISCFEHHLPTNTSTFMSPAQAFPFNPRIDLLINKKLNIVEYRTQGLFFITSYSYPNLVISHLH